MWKIFYPGQWSSLTELTNRYPGYAEFYFCNHNGQAGAMMIKDKSVKKYGEPIKCNDGIVIWLGDGFIFTPEKWCSCPTMLNNTIKLANGRSIQIHPALIEPEVVCFGAPVDTDKSEYTTRYGRLAYEIRDLIYKAKTDGKAFVPDFNDDRFIDLIGLALEKSYEIPVQLWQISKWVTTWDLMPIFWASLDMPELPASPEHKHQIDEAQKKNTEPVANGSNLQ